MREYDGNIAGRLLIATKDNVPPARSTSGLELNQLPGLSPLALEGRHRPNEAPTASVCGHAAATPSNELTATS